MKSDRLKKNEEMIRNLKPWVESFGRMLRKDTRRVPLPEAISEARE